MADDSLPLDELPDPLAVPPLAGPFDASVTVPGSKSITNRAYVLAALAEGTSRIVRPLRADDTDRLLAALATLGAGVRHDGADVLIEGVGGRFPRGGRVDLGDGGTPTRFMIAAAALAEAPVVVDGSPRMRERPVAEGVDLMRRLGALVEYVEQPERLPVRVVPAERLGGGTLEVPTTLSSQFISAIMLVAPFLAGGVAMRFTGAVTSASYVELTADVLGVWGVPVGRDDDAAAGPGRLQVSPGAVAGRAFAVEPDASSAAYWMVATTLVAGARMTLPGVRRQSIQPDMGMLPTLEGVGLRVEPTEDGIRLEGPPALSAGLDVDAHAMPDAALALAVAAACAPHPSALRGLHTLRVKETDRVAALAAELGKIGCAVEATEDTLAIDPAPRHDRPVVIDTYNDHRMAMAFAVLGLVRPGIAIADPACVAKSYPTFWRDLARLTAPGV